MAAMAPDRDALEALPDLEKAIEDGYISFSQFVQADWGRSMDGPAAPAYRRLFPDVLGIFQASHGIIEDRFSASEIKCYAARTSPVKGDPSRKVQPPERAHQPDFHFVYDLGSTPIGGELLTRIEMMASDATTVLKGRRLREFLDQLYSKTTDVLGLILHAAAPDSKVIDVQPGSARTAGAAPPGDLKASAAAANGLATSTSLADRLAIIAHDIDIIELKYLITAARLKHFAGAVMSMSLIGVAVIVGALMSLEIKAFAELGRGFALVLIFGAAGALLSVVQRMSSNTLDVRYDLGAAYTRLLGGFRPLIGAFAGVLAWLLVQARILANPTTSDFFLAAIAFALGVAERSLGDVVTESGIMAKLTPGGSSNRGSKTHQAQPEPDTKGGG
jgi:hypothetical protein